MQSSANIKTTKIDGALGAMIIEDQPTHSICLQIVARITTKVNVKAGY